MNRREFGKTIGGMALTGAVATPPLSAAQSSAPASPVAARVPDPGSFDPWVEVIADAIRNNVRELNRFSGRPLLAVIKNNANGIGLREIGPILDQMDQVYGLAVARVDEGLALRDVGVRKPVVIMAHASPAEAEELARHDVRLTLFHADARQQTERLAASVGRPVPVHVMVDSGMNRIGMPYERALAWLEDLAASDAIRIEATYTMFSGATRDGAPFDAEHLRRFMAIVDEARRKGIDLGRLHGAPSSQIVRFPESHQLDLIRPGGAIYGLAAYRSHPDGAEVMDIRPTFRLRARVSRVHRLEIGEGVSFGHRYVAERPTWIATIPIGHTDGYPREAAGKTLAYIDGATYPLIAVVSSNHVEIEVGDEPRVNVGDVATLVGPDHPDITPHAVATRTGLGRDYWIMTKLNALLHRIVV